MNNDTLKKCILTPTFSGHFQYLGNYLNSFRKNVTDKDRCVIYFIINSDEDKALQKIVKKYPDLDIRILFFEDILQKFGIALSPAFLLEKYGKFSFQALKKFYGMLYLENYKHFLVLDTESIWLNEVSMEKMFNDFFDENPFIIYSNVEKRLKTSPSNREASDNINYVLESKCNKWFVEQYVRFWDVDILKDIFKKAGSCFEIVEKINKKEKNFYPKLGLFESVLYDQFIYEHNDRYRYRLVDLDEECEKYIPQQIFLKYRQNMAKIWNGSCGLLESSSILLDKNNYKGFAEVFRNNHLNIIRVETEPQNYKWQRMFLEIVKPDILTCSQENLFGENATLKNFLQILFIKSKSIKRLKKQLVELKSMIKSVLHVIYFPIKFALNLLGAFIYAIVNIIKMLPPPPYN